MSGTVDRIFGLVRRVLGGRGPDDDTPRDAESDERGEDSEPVQRSAPGTLIEEAEAPSDADRRPHPPESPIAADSESSHTDNEPASGDEQRATPDHADDDPSRSWIASITDEETLEWAKSLEQDDTDLSATQAPVRDADHLERAAADADNGAPEASRDEHGFDWVDEADIEDAQSKANDGDSSGTQSDVDRDEPGTSRDEHEFDWVAGSNTAREGLGDDADW